MRFEIAFTLVKVKNPYISTRELEGEVGISQRKIKDNLKKLKELGLIERIGKAKGGHWKVST